MTKRLTVVLTAALALVVLGLPAPSGAATLTGGFTATPGCTDFTMTEGTFTTTRDNTGAAEEAYYYEVRDGVGTLLARYPLSGTYSWAYPSSNVYGGVTLPYNITTPSYNPLTVRWISPAGNGQLEQVFYENTGTCQGLQEAVDPVPTLQGWGVLLLASLVLAAGVIVLLR